MDTTLPEIIRQGRTLTANIQGQRGPTILSGLSAGVAVSNFPEGNLGGLGGLEEFWQCVKNTPPARAKECLQHLISRDGNQVEIDIFKQKIPLKFELKPDWVWFAAGFLTAWILKR